MTTDRPYREVRFEYTPDFPSVLRHLRSSLVVSTYQAGKLVAVSAADDKLAFSFHQFERAMGVAVSNRSLAIGSRRNIYFLQPSPDLAPAVEPRGTFDSLWLARRSFITGNIHGHELAWGTDGLWIVNTLFSALCTLRDDFNFVPRWRPPFISELAAEDRCHLNGVAMDHGRPRFVSVMAESNEAGGWRPTKATSGCVLDVASGEAVTRGLCMPHSPRWHDGRLWLLDSGVGALCVVDLATGRREVVERFPGYTRGLAFAGQFAFVGLSKIRETSVFGGVPIAERRNELRCGVGAVDLHSGRTVAVLQFHSGVDEVFAIDVLTGSQRPYLQGPNPEDDSQQDIWVVPPMPGQSAPAEHHCSPQPLAQLARDRQAQGDPVGAAAAFQQALALEPHRADLHCDLGNVWQELNDPDAALASYQRAVAADPDFVLARQNLGYLLYNRGEPEQALEHYEHALAVRPSPMSHMLAATVLPVIYDSAEDVTRWRKRFASRIGELVETGLCVDTTRTPIPTNFYLAYQGRNDRAIAADLGRIYQGVELCPPAQGRPLKPRSDGRLRIGFLSAYFHDHTIGRLNLGRVQHLSRQKLEVTVISVGHGRDELAAQFESAADRFVSVPRHIETARQTIADQDLDVLIFADVGMDAVTSTLVYSRMAPVQCVTWGHPDTTGSPAIDYFLSSDLLETADADKHYTERLVRLPQLGVFYSRPKRTGPPRSRDHFGLSDRRHVYLCPQTLFKFHPDFDAVLAGILAADPAGDIVLLDGRIKTWTDRLRRRFAHTIPDAERRVRFLPLQAHDDYLALLETANVVLDPLHFGGGNSSYEALALHAPVVTLPSSFLRGRITFALYQKMGFRDLIVDSIPEYIGLAVRLATDRGFRDSIRRRIAETVPILFEDPREVRTLEEFLWSLVGVQPLGCREAQ